MKSKSNKRTTILAVVLLALLIVGYKIVFVPSADTGNVEENIAASQRVEGMLAKVKSISFDMSVMENQKFQSLKSLETPLISLPIGKKNPFSAD